MVKTFYSFFCEGSRNVIFIRKNWNNSMECVFNFSYFLQSYPTQNRYLTNPLPPLSRSYSNYYSPLDVCTILFIVIPNCKNDLICLIISFVFWFFSLHVLDKLDLEVLNSWMFSYLHILNWYLTLNIRHTIITVGAHFIVRFIIFVVSSYLYLNNYIQYCRINDITHVAHILHMV